MLILKLRAISNTLKILFIRSNPIGVNNLELDREENRIRDALDKSEFRDQISFESRGAITKVELVEELVKTKPNILHISGHGNNQQQLFLEDGDGYKEGISIGGFGDLLSDFSEHIKCVILNACYSLNGIDNLNPEIPFVIGMKKDIQDHIAIEFSEVFYISLFNGKSVRDSYQIAWGTVKLKHDKLTPVFIDNTNEQNIPLLPIKEDPEDGGALTLEKLHLIRTQLRSEIKFYYIIITVSVLISLTLIIFLVTRDKVELLTTIVSGLFPNVVGNLPSLKIIQKKKDKMMLINLLELRMKRLKKALILSNDEIDRLNKDFSNLVDL